MPRGARHRMGDQVAAKKRSTSRQGNGRGWRRREPRRGSSLLRWVRRIIVVLILIALVPAALALVYRIHAIHPVSTLMLRDIVLLRPMQREWVDLEKVSPALVRSVVMSEDGQFCSHDGVDWGALNSVIDDALDGERVRGASTITMQSVKNLFLWNSRSFIRKALEIPYALWTDAVLPKRRIMEIYLNIAEWDDDIYGIGAASKHYFGKPASDLTRREAALLAVTLPNPSDRNPGKPGSGLRKLANVIEKRASNAGSHVDCLLPE